MLLTGYPRESRNCCSIYNCTVVEGKLSLGKQRAADQLQLMLPFHPDSADTVMACIRLCRRFCRQPWAAPCSSARNSSSGLALP